MSIEQTRACHRCQRQNRREDKICSRCGADLDWLNDDQRFISAGLTIASAVLTIPPFIIIPILLVWNIDISKHPYFTFESQYVAVAVFVAMLLAACAGGLAIVRGVVRQRNRSVARGILIGIGAGLLLGVASCMKSFDVFYNVGHLSS